MVIATPFRLSFDYQSVCAAVEDSYDAAVAEVGGPRGDARSPGVSREKYSVRNRQTLSKFLDERREEDPSSLELARRKAAATPVWRR